MINHSIPFLEKQKEIEVLESELKEIPEKKKEILKKYL